MNSTNELSEDPILMMLKYGKFTREQELKASQITKLYYNNGGFVGTRDNRERLALHYAIRKELWHIGKVVAKEHLKEKYNRNTLPIRKSEIQSEAIYTSLRMREPNTFIKYLAEIGKKSIDEELWPTPSNQNDWTRTLLNLIPKADSEKKEMDWEPLKKVLQAFAENEPLFDNNTKYTLLNVREIQKKLKHHVPEELLDIHVALGLVDPDPESTQTFLHSLVSNGAPAEIIISALELGADSKKKSSIRVLGKKNERFSIGQQTFLHQIAANGDRELIEKLSEYNVNFNLQDGFGKTVLSTYIEYNNISIQDLLTVHTMLKHGADPELSDNEGRNSIEKTEDHKNRYIVALLKNFSKSHPPIQKKKEKVYTTYLRGEAIEISEHDLAIQIQNLEKRLYNNGFFKKPTAEESEILTRIGLLDKDEAAKKNKMEYDLFEDVEIHVDSKAISKLESPYHKYLYIRALESCSSGKTGNDDAFTKLLPHLLYNHPIEIGHFLARRLEGRMDSIRGRKGFKQTHTNAVELMALLNHPRDHKRDRLSLGSYTSALTSIHYFYGKNKVATGSIADLWGKIGTYGFNGIIWRFDAERIKGVNEKGKEIVEAPSLLESYGANALSPDAYERNAIFGPSFLVAPKSKLAKRITQNSLLFPEDQLFDDDTFVELHRGCFVVSHPIDGTLIIRNSSPVFGRDLLEEPAYFSPMGISRAQEPFSLSMRELVHITPEAISDPLNQFKSVLSKELYHQQRIGKRAPETSDEIFRMHRLMKRLHTLRTDYSRWKFDTKRNTAWSKGKEPELIGGYHSPGFSAVFRYLEKRFQNIQIDNLVHGGSTKIMPELAFIHPNLAPFSPYARMRVTEETIDVLRKLTKGEELLEIDMEDSQIRDFFMIGFKQDADLVLIAPERKY